MNSAQSEQLAPYSLALTKHPVLSMGLNLTCTFSKDGMPETVLGAVEWA
jgi:hypothetical protein